MNAPDPALDHRLACVSRVPLFADLSDDDRRRVAEVAVTRRYERGEQVYRPGEESGLRIVHGGRIKVHRVSDSGAEQLIRILFPGDFLGETTLLTGRPVDSWAVALERAEVCTLGRAQMDRLLRERPRSRCGCWRRCRGGSTRRSNSFRR